MENIPFDLEKRYQEFLSQERAYHEKREKSSDLESLRLQYEWRIDVLQHMGALCEYLYHLADLGDYFLNNSNLVLAALNRYTNCLTDRGVKNAPATKLINHIVKLASKKESVIIK